MENADCLSLTRPSATIDTNERAVLPIDNVGGGLNCFFNCSVCIVCRVEQCRVRLQVRVSHAHKVGVV